MKIGKLEAIRGFAAIYVVIHHFIGFTIIKNKLPSLIRFPFRFGQEAVILFFLMSGFVIYVSVAKSNNLTFIEYFKRRAIRIYPIAIVAFVISISILFLNGNHLKNYDYKSLAGNLLMLQDTDGSKPGNIARPFLDNFPLWSLSYEWWFYMLFYPIFYLKSKRHIIKINSTYLVLFISIAGWLAFIFIPNHMFLVLAYFSIWWAGVACGEIYLANKDFAFKSLIPVILSLLVMTSLMFIPVIETYLNHGRLSQILYPVLTFRHYFFAFIIIIIGWGWWKIKLFKFDMLLGWFTRIAPISYGIYIIHFSFIWLTIPFINPYVVILLKLALIFILAYLLEARLQPVLNTLFFKKKVVGKVNRITASLT